MRVLRCEPRYSVICQGEKKNKKKEGKKEKELKGGEAWGVLAEQFPRTGWATECRKQTRCSAQKVDDGLDFDLGPFVIAAGPGRAQPRSRGSPKNQTDTRTGTMTAESSECGHVRQKCSKVGLRFLCAMMLAAQMCCQFPMGGKLQATSRPDELFREAPRPAKTAGNGKNSLLGGLGVGIF